MPVTGKVMFQGVTSGAGKTTLTAALCRHLALQGREVVPFKAQNVSLNSFVTADGREIAIAQAYQAWACGLEPEADMNPVLVKPKGNGQCQIMLEGRPWRDLGPGEGGPEIIEGLRAHILEAFHRTALGRDAVVLEGMGSPVEMNLKERDVANMWLAKAVRSPVVLVADIEQGGAFAGLYGTYLLFDEEERDLLRGFIINRFRGDASILRTGIEELESRMEIPCLGVLPLVRFASPAEDSLSLSGGVGGRKGDDVRRFWMKELDRLLEGWEGAWNLDHILDLIDKV